MNPLNPCLCCSGNLLRHVRGTGVYWFCPSCRQEMPDLSVLVNQLRRTELDRVPV